MQQPRVHHPKHRMFELSGSCDLVLSSFWRQTSNRDEILLGEMAFYLLQANTANSRTGASPFFKVNGDRIPHVKLNFPRSDSPICHSIYFVHFQTNTNALRVCLSDDCICYRRILTQKQNCPCTELSTALCRHIHYLSTHHAMKTYWGRWRVAPRH